MQNRSDIAAKMHRLVCVMSPKRLNYLHLLKLHTRETAAVNKPYALPSIHRDAVEGKIVRQKTNATTLLTTCFLSIIS